MVTENSALPTDDNDPILPLMETFEQQWRSNSHPRIEDYLLQVDDAYALELLEELIAVEVQLRRDDGQLVTVEEYESRFRDHSHIIRRVIAELDDPSIASVSKRSKSSQSQFAGEPAAKPHSHQPAPVQHDGSTQANINDTVSADSSESSVNPQRTYDSAGPQSPSKTSATETDFGEYELVEEIARGGMGVVFKARQKRLNRIVALKMILAGGLAGEDEVQRFQTEAEAAANLQHPGIVPIYEVGEHDGRHFYSMGFVEGSTLDDLIDDGPLDCSQAAKLVENVAHSIAYAHQNGVIHRDLKLGNILIDADGIPLVTDFGLAKRTDIDTGLTGTGQILGTPSYMAPEQAAAKTDEIGPLSDVYSLGAILYCLLTGRPPFQAANVMDTLLAVMKQEAVPPHQLNPAIDRDLETICLKCLQKEPSKRYETADALADDLSNYLGQRPIEARPTGRIERSWRWCRRNQLATSVIALVLLIAVVSPIVAVLQFRLREEADSNRELAVANSEKYKLEKDRADQEAQRVVGLLEKVEDERDNAHEQLEQHRRTLASYITTVINSQLLRESRFSPLKRSLLQGALDHYRRFATANEEDPNLWPEVASAFYTIGQLCGETGALLKEEMEAYQLELKIRKRLADMHPTNTVHRRKLAVSHQHVGDMFSRIGEHQSAIKAHRDALAIFEQLCEDPKNARSYRYGLARSHSNLGRILASAGQKDVAEVEYKQGLEILNQVVQENPKATGYKMDLATGYNNFATFCRRTGNAPAAISALKMALSIHRQAKSSRSSLVLHRANVASVLHNLGEVYLVTSREGEAQKLLDESYQISHLLARNEPTVPMHLKNAAICKAQLASLHAKRNRLKEARQAYDSALELHEQLVERFPYSTHRVYFARCCYNMAKFLDSDQPESAVVLLSKADEAIQAVLKEAPRDAYAKGFLNDIRFFRSRVTLRIGSSSPESREINLTIDRYRRAWNADSDNVDALISLTSALGSAGRDAEAIDILKKALVIHPANTRIHHSLGSAFERTGTPAKAIDAYRAAIRSNPTSEHAYYGLGHVLHRMGRFSQAVEAYKKAIDLKPDSSVAFSGMGMSFRKLKLPKEAAAAFRRVIELSPDSYQDYRNLGLVLRDQGELDEALAAFRKALEIQPQYTKAQISVGSTLYAQGQIPEAIEAYRAAIEIDSENGAAYGFLGRALDRLKNYDEAIKAYQRAIELNPNNISNYINLGSAFSAQRKPAEAIKVYRKAIKLDPTETVAYYNLGNSLRNQGNLDEAIKAFQQALAINPKYAEAYCNIGNVLKLQGKYLAALPFMKKGHELGSQRPRWPWNSAMWLEELESLAEMERGLPNVLDPKTRPAESRKLLQFAEFCRRSHRYVEAVSLYKSVLENNKLDEKQTLLTRYQAACCAAIASRLREQPKAQAEWRKQGVEWLRANLKARAKQIEAGTQREQETARRALSAWQRTPLLEGLRHPNIINSLSDAEKKDLQLAELWADVDSLLK